MAPAPWWSRDDLCYRGGALHLAGMDLSQSCGVEETPHYFYSAPRILGNLERVHHALDKHGVNHRVFYAMKSNRCPDVLRLLADSGRCGIDACSPAEVERAIDCRFRSDQISFTATALSQRDFAALEQHDGLIFNLDSVSGLRAWGRRKPGAAVGVRVNPEASLGYRDHAQLQYAGEGETKFGIYPNQWEDVLAVAAEYRLNLRGIHCHAGCGFLDLERLPRVLENVAAFVQKLPGAEYINLGGGLGIPLDAQDAPLDLDRWAEMMADFQRQTGCPLYFEPGDYIVKDSGVLVATVTMVETKRSTTFVGLDTGFNAHIEPAFYHLPLHPVPLREPTTPESLWRPVTLSGNINEALDIFYRDILFPPVEEGDQIALLNAGGYGASMASQHCLRPIPLETVVA